MSTNWVYDIIEDSIFISLEDGPWLPKEFELTIDDATFQCLIKNLVITSTGKPVEPTAKRVGLKIQEHHVTVKSDEEPEPWVLEATLRGDS